MWDKIKQLTTTISIVAMTVLGSFIQWIEVIQLQKAFYIVSILVALKVYMDWKKHTKKKDFGIAKVSKSVGLIEGITCPECKIKRYEVVFHKIRNGGIKMLSKIKSLGAVKIGAILIDIILIGIGVASVYVPGLAFVGEYLVELFILVGATSLVGAVTKGASIGESLKNSKDKKAAIKKLALEIKEYLKEKDELAVIYAPALTAKARVDSLGGELTADEKLSYNNYVVQSKALGEKIAKSETALAELRQ